MTYRSTIQRLLVLALFATASQSAMAEIDTFRVWHHSGTCAEFPFPSAHLNWSGRSRINIATGERIHVRLYGHGADKAENAGADGIHEWILDKGTTTDYPNAPIVGGQKVPKGYVTVAIEATSAHGTGNRTVTVTWPWPGQPETIPVRIVSSCNTLLDDAYRLAPETPTAGTSNFNTISPPPTSTITAPAPVVDLVPRASVSNIFRRTGNPVLVNNVYYLPVDGRWCNDFPIPISGSASRTITVPNITWGVTNVGSAPNGAAFTSMLSTGTVVLSAPMTAAGALAPGATVNFAFTRPNSVARVIRFAIPQPQGCFVNPNDQGFWEDPMLTVSVDSVPPTPPGAVVESNEDNNRRTF
jgi:hypothetical protein